MVYLSRPYHFKFFKGCLPQILFGLFLNTLTHFRNWFILYFSIVSLQKQRINPFRPSVAFLIEISHKIK